MFVFYKQISIAIYLHDAPYVEMCLNDSRMIGLTANALTAPAIASISSVNRAMVKLQSTMQKVSAWPQLDRYSGRGLATLVKRANETDVAKTVLKAVANSIPESNAMISWLEGVGEILDGAITMDPDQRALSDFSIAKSSIDYLHLIAEVQGRIKKDLIRFLKPGCSPRDVIINLNEAVQNSSQTIFVEPSITEMLRVECSWPWSEFTAIGTRMQVDQQLRVPGQNPAMPNLPADEIGRNLRVILRLRSISGSDFALHQMRNLFAIGWFWWHFQIVSQSGEPTCIASAILAALLFDPAGNLGPQNQATQAGRGAYQNIVRDRPAPIATRLKRALSNHQS
jgi:hypothetical protein